MSRISSTCDPVNGSKAVPRIPFQSLTLTVRVTDLAFPRIRRLERQHFVCKDSRRLVWQISDIDFMPQGDTVLKNELLKRLAGASQMNTTRELDKHRDSNHSNICWNIHENAFVSACAFLLLHSKAVQNP
jgi:hypothetical protein